MAEDMNLNVPKYITIVQRQEATDDSYCYVAYHPELPNCMSQGDTPEEAEANLIEATELAIAHLTSNNLPIPKPISWLTADVPLQMMIPVAFTNDLSMARSGVYDSIEERMTAPSFRLEPSG